mmetsp:Transcript_125162/g.359462  ORF Transcript_125162/g.359462 Transcript_125162/m.359462 type:complete len:263 (+) Transcript_125162:445-1233(+)
MATMSAPPLKRKVTSLCPQRSVFPSSRFTRHSCMRPFFNNGAHCNGHGGENNTNSAKAARETQSKGLLRNSCGPRTATPNESVAPPSAALGPSSASATKAKPSSFASAFSMYSSSYGRPSTVAIPRSGPNSKVTIRPPHLNSVSNFSNRNCSKRGLTGFTSTTGLNLTFFTSACGASTPCCCSLPTALALAPPSRRACPVEVLGKGMPCGETRLRPNTKFFAACVGAQNNPQATRAASQAARKCRAQTRTMATPRKCPSISR